MSPGVARKRRSQLFSFTSCGCKDSKSVSVSMSETSEKSTATPSSRTRGNSSGDTPITSTSSGFQEEEESSRSPANFSGLLRQLSDLERSVMALSRRPVAAETGRNERWHHHHHHHRRCRSEGSGRVEESVAVVKETEDPLGDFRRSMLQMIVENEIVGGSELQELLRRFLSLNSPRHHYVILRAFAEIWAEVFSGYEKTPEFLKAPQCPRML